MIKEKMNNELYWTECHFYMFMNNHLVRFIADYRF